MPYRDKNIHKEKHKAFTSNYRDILKGRFGSWKHGAKDRGIPFELAIEDLESMPLVCHYTGATLNTKANNYFTVSLDRLDSSKGYTKDNVVFCCGFINVMKHKLSYAQFIRACAKVAQHCGAREIQL